MDDVTDAPQYGSARVAVKVDVATVDAERRLFGVAHDEVVLGRFRVRAPIGSGAFGDVYRAFDPLLEREVALKLVAMRSDEPRERMLNEARALARVRHPNAVTVHEVGEARGCMVLVLDLLRGRTLREAVAERALALPAALTVFCDIGEALAAAHAAGVVHGDVKPDNVVVEDGGRPVLVDFGVARLAGRHGGGGGTAAYLAPECRHGRAWDAAADQYAFCVALAEVTAALAADHVGLPRGVARRIAAIVERGTADEPRSRWPDMHAVVAALRSIQRPAPRRPLVIALITAVAAILVSGSALQFTMYWHWLDRRRDAMSRARASPSVARDTPAR